ncbi:MAG: hypothetical protein ACOYL6_08775 [Bacteriovoracaceae bacterium]
MNCCQKELVKLIQVYEARIGKTENYLVELDFKGKSSSLNYKINDKLVILLGQIIKDLKQISDSISHEQEDESLHKRNSLGPFKR